MSSETPNDEMGDTPVLITPQGVQMKITTEIAKSKLTVADLEMRALAVEKNEDNLKTMADLLADLDKVDDVATEVHKKEKRPHLDAGNACDAGKKLVLSETDRIRQMIKPDYDRLLADVAQRKLLQDQEIAQDDAILKTVEDNVMNFSNRIVGAVTKKALLDVERLINLEKSPSMAKKYGEYHSQAIERYDTVLIPIIKDQKLKVDRLEDYKQQLQQAEVDNDLEKMAEINTRIDELSNEMLRNHEVMQEAALKQATITITKAVEVLPGFKVKRTNYSFEIDDVEVALKKSRALLEISINKEAARVELDKLKEQNAFEGKDFVVVNGIKYIATRVRAAT